MTLPRVMLNADIAAAQARIDTARWGILPGRRVSHALLTAEGKLHGICDQTSLYRDEEILEPTSTTRRCEQCLITLISTKRVGMHKFMVGHVPADVRQERRRCWREFRRRTTWTRASPTSTE
jgi:hypothetical protein